MTVEELWAELVTTALLGTDRRDPPDAGGLIGDVVADTVRSEPSARMLATVAACTAVRRAGVRPAAALDPLAPPPVDDRPACPPAAADRWRHITNAWPVLEDEWTVVLIEHGWRMTPEVVVPALHRHRRDAVRRTRVMVAAGPLADWLLGHVPDLAPPPTSGPALDDEGLAALPELPIPPQFVGLLDATGSEVGGTIGVGLEDGSLGAPHRAVLINLLARCAPDALGDAADVLGAVDSRSPGHGLASLLGDLATTRRRMLDELAPSDASTS